MPNDKNNQGGKVEVTHLGKSRANLEAEVISAAVGMIICGPSAEANKDLANKLEMHGKPHHAEVARNKTNPLCQKPKY